MPFARAGKGVVANAGESDAIARTRVCVAGRFEALSRLGGSGERALVSCTILVKRRLTLALAVDLSPSGYQIRL